MAATALEMLKDALDSFVHRDPVKARQVIPRDKGLDQQNKRLHRDLTALMSEKSIYITRALNLMVISKSLERIGDHAANVAEQVVYLCEGLDIRHDAGTGRSEPGPSPRSPGVPRPD